MWVKPGGTKNERGGTLNPYGQHAVLGSLYRSLSLQLGTELSFPT